jgi:response regulator RpfG family c-di-GMP phosphodiesterase
MNEKILFVDDEPNVLQSIQRQLRKRFTLEIAEGGEEALRILRENGPFAVIVSDMRMPNMNGVELLALVKDLYPDTVRLMLTGNADQETAMEAVNSGQIFRFLTKPCPQATFVTSLALALRQHRLVSVEKELLQKTLKGCISVLSELLGVANPLAFSAGLRIKNYVVGVADHLNLRKIWQYEIAALMSQIGCFSLPAEILNNVYADQKLSVTEEEMYRNHPAVGAALLEKIPRLENITQMIALQMTRYDAFDDALAQTQTEEVLIGAQILKAAIDFDRRLFMGMDHEQAINWMRKQKNCFNPKVLEALSTLRMEGRGQILSLKVEQITDGMVTTENVTTKSGVLIIPKGQMITKPLLQGLKNFSAQVGVVEPIRVQIGQTAEEISS